MDNYPFQGVILVSQWGLLDKYSLLCFDGFRMKTPFSNILIHNGPLGPSILWPWLTPMKRLYVTFHNVGS